MPKKRDETKWRESTAKELLVQDLISGKIPLEGKRDAKKHYNSRPEFQRFEYKNFRTNLQTQRSLIINDKASAQFDIDAVARHERICPAKSHNNRGEPQWVGSTAEGLLRVDMAAGKHLRMTPMQLYMSKDEYQVHKEEVFRKRIYQSERKRKYKNYLASLQR
jgi:hypothetical protein